jgi:hypothetical protein
VTTFDATIGASVVQAPINFSASGDNIIIPGVAGKRIKVLQFFFVLAATTNLTYKSGSTALSGPLDFGSNAAQVQDFIQLPYTCNVGDPFIINSSSAVQVGGTVWYVQG